MADDTPYTTDALSKLGSNLKTYSRSLPMADYLGTVCADPGVRVVNTGGYIKSYTTLGGLILPYDATGKDEFAAMIATALMVKKMAKNDAEIMFIMGHENCLFIGAMHKVLLGAKDQFPIRGRFIEALLAGELGEVLTEVVTLAAKRGDDTALVVRVMTELMVLESLRNFRGHVVDNDLDTIADYMDGEVKGAPRLNILPALTLRTGEVIYFDPAANKFTYKKDIELKAGGGKSIEDILDAARNNFITRIREGDYSDLIITPASSNAKTANLSR